MKRIQWLIVSGVVLLAAGTGWWVGSQAGRASVPTDAQGSSTAVSRSHGMDRAHEISAVPVQAERTGPSAAAPHATTTTPAPVTSRPAPRDAGPRPMTPEGEARIEALLAGLRRTDDATTQDYELLARSEPSDPDSSPRLESLIQQVIDRHARDLGHLEITRPRCGKTLCMLAAASHVPQTQHPQADFSRLTGHMFAEPWFREAFFDQQTTVHSDRRGVVYVSYFIRK
jgi:hypothetical protein